MPYHIVYIPTAEVLYSYFAHVPHTFKLLREAEQAIKDNRGLYITSLIYKLRNELKDSSAYLNSQPMPSTDDKVIPRRFLCVVKI